MTTIDHSEVRECTEQIHQLLTWALAASCDTPLEITTATELKHLPAGSSIKLSKRLQQKWNYPLAQGTVLEKRRNPQVPVELKESMKHTARFWLSFHQTSLTEGGGFHYTSIDLPVQLVSLGDIAEPVRLLNDRINTLHKEADTLP